METLPLSSPSGDAALYIDWDNLKISLSSLNRSPNVSVLFDAAEEYGRVVLARAYADWTMPSLSTDPPNLYAAGIEAIYVPCRHFNGNVIKNSADIRLAVDCIDHVTTLPNISTCIIVSGDGDLIHLVNFLRMRGKRVILICVRGATSGQLESRVDKVLEYERDIDPVGNRGSLPPEAAIIEQTLAALREYQQQQDGRPFLFTQLKNTLISRWRFDEKRYGYRSFKDFMKALEQTGKIRIITQELRDWATLPEYADFATSWDERREVEEQRRTEALPGAASTSLTLDTISPAQRTAFFAAIARFAQSSPYLTRSYIGKNLIYHSVLPTLSSDQVQTLVEDAVSRGIFERSVREVPHKETGAPFYLRTLIFQADHPDVRASISRQADFPPPEGGADGLDGLDRHENGSAPAASHLVEPVMAGGTSSDLVTEARLPAVASGLPITWQAGNIKRDALFRALAQLDARSPFLTFNYIKDILAREAGVPGMTLNAVESFVRSCIDVGVLTRTTVQRLNAQREVYSFTQLRFHAQHPLVAAASLHATDLEIDAEPAPAPPTEAEVLAAPEDAIMVATQQPLVGVLVADEAHDTAQSIAEAVGAVIEPESLS